jgi:toxin ParE1/3/4
MGRLPIELHPAAVAEARAAFARYQRSSPAAAERFLDELDCAIDKISQYPQKWARHSHGTRRYSLKRFPYLVIYRELETTAQVVAVAHGHRRPGYWRFRLKDDAK